MSRINPTVQLERLLVRAHPGARGGEMEEDREGFGGVDSEGFSEYDGEVESPPAGRPGKESAPLSTSLKLELALGDPLLIRAHFAALDYVRVLAELVASADDVQEGRTQAVVLLLGSWGSG